MDLYGEFAYFYTKGPYLFSERMAELLPAVLEQFNAQPSTLLDLACGDGRFAVIMAQRGLQMTGVDLSPQMLRFARERAEEAGVEVTFLQQDMRYLSVQEKFDLVTCWFDSLNYLLEYEDLVRTFSSVHRALSPGGLFIFDMNTIYGLAVHWQRHPAGVEQDTEELFEIHCPDYDFEKNVATLKITGFRKEGESWQRIEEVHRERGYTLEQIRGALEQANLEVLACWGSLKDMTEPTLESPRVWFVTHREKR